jgi:hypothetical protein
MIKEAHSERIPEDYNGIPLAEIVRAISGIKHGYLQVIIQNSRVVQIDKMEKMRISGEQH